MLIQRMNGADGSWHDVAEPETWIRLVVGHTCYDINESDHGLRISCNGRILIIPVVANAILVYDGALP